MHDICFSPGALAVFAAVAAALNGALWIVWTVYLASQAQTISILVSRITELAAERDRHFARLEAQIEALLAEVEAGHTMIERLRNGG